MDSYKSVVFDRAADFYDKTRALTPEAQQQIVQRLTTELADTTVVLEVGIGTGRIALPLIDAGVNVIGLDLSQPMLRRLVENASGAHVDLFMADATNIAIADSSVDAALGCHILHLIADWRTVLREMVRVVKPGGRILIDAGGVGWNPDPLEQVFARTSGLNFRHIGLESVEELDAEMTSIGARVRLLDPVVEVRRSSPASRLNAWRQNLYSFTWRLDDDVRLQAVDAAQAWAREHLGDLDVPVEREVPIVWRAYDLP